MLKIALIEDDPVFSKNLEESLRLQPNFNIWYTAKSIRDFWDRLPAKASTDLILVDILLPEQSGVEAIPALKRRFPNTEIIMLTVVEDGPTLIRALNLGATGYLNKDFSLLQFPKMLGALSDNHALLSPQMAKILIQYFNPPATGKQPDKLIEKEIKLLKLFELGLTYEEAANAMNISENGIRYHIKNIYRKMNVKNKTQALKIFKSMTPES